MSYVIVYERASASAREVPLKVPATHILREIMEAIGIRSMGSINGEEWEQVISLLDLPAQQARIVELILHNHGDKQIARAMGLAEPTVRTYLSRIFRRLECNDRVGLVLKVFLCVLELRERNGGRQK